MAIVISGSTGIDMGNTPVSNASQIDSTVVNENGVGLVNETQLALKANTADLKEIGVGQTWQSFTVGTQRIVGTTYTNTTGKPITVAIRGILTSGGSNVSITVGGILIAVDDCSNNSWGYCEVIVPDNGTYSLSSASFTTLVWSELR